MLEITIPQQEFFNNETQMFVYTPEQTIRLEHSLVSISKWESKYHKSFLNSSDKTNAELIDYIRCMCITQNVDDDLFNNLSEENLRDVTAYINDPMTATTINNRHQTRSREIVTSELIYYWMISLNIPFECQKWHINRLLTLISVCSEKNNPKKKMGTNAILNENAALNAKRRAAMKSKG